VHEKPRKSNAGAKPFDVVLMFMVLILQHLYNLSDDGIEYQIRDRLSFMRFLGLQLEDRVPDAKTVWLFRERLKGLELVEVLFARFDEQLAQRGYVAKAGQMIDATFVEAPRQRNTREENAKIKAGELPDGWDDPEQAARTGRKTPMLAGPRRTTRLLRLQKPPQCRCRDQVDPTLRRDPANVHDSQVFDELLDTETRTAGRSQAPVYADSAYRSAEREADLAKQGLESQIHEKGTRAAPLTEDQKASNRKKSTVRARVEHIFGAQAAMDGHVIRTIGLAGPRSRSAC